MLSSLKNVVKLLNQSWMIPVVVLSWPYHFRPNFQEILWVYQKCLHNCRPGESIWLGLLGKAWGVLQ